MNAESTPAGGRASMTGVAPDRLLPNGNMYSIEYPGYVRDASVPHAVRTLGGQQSLDMAFRRNASKQDQLLELNMRPDNPFSHPIPGEVVPSNNIVLKVVKRKRVHPDTDDNNKTVGEYTIEAVGFIPKTVRFRSMADFQFQPDMEDPISRLRTGMEKLDVEAIREFRITPEKENYTLAGQSSSPDMDIDPVLVNASTERDVGKSNMRFFPPPLFTRQGIPQNYFFKANPMSVVTTVIDDETGVESKRMVNRMRWKGYGPATIMYSDPEVPTKPPAHIEEVRSQHDQRLLKELERLFEERPIWTRGALFNQFTPAEAREIHNSKVTLPLSCFVFHDGPWRDTMLRFGYDPRKNVEARFYQRLYFRNLNHPIARPSVVARRSDNRYSATAFNRIEASGLSEERRSHIFDGRSLTSETAAFQLCDILDPMLKGMIEDESEIRDACNERDGWYTTHALERIKTVLRHKFFSLLEGYLATDEECVRLLESQVDPKTPKPTTRKPRAGKHNMAKGALPPEDVAAIRLRATLDRNVKMLQSQKHGPL